MPPGSGDHVKGRIPRISKLHASPTTGVAGIREPPPTHALARRAAPTPPGMRARHAGSPLIMRMAHPRPWRMETRAPAFPRRCPADRRRLMLEPSTPRRPPALIAGTPSACALGVLGHAPRFTLAPSSVLSGL